MLNREPMGMKRTLTAQLDITIPTGFSAQPRADGDEAQVITWNAASTWRFSAQPRADGDEATTYRLTFPRLHAVSVLNREPMGMKPKRCYDQHSGIRRFSAQPRADGDEAALPRSLRRRRKRFSAQPRADGDEA